ncbi:MAG: polysaccharide pyruvyl transferase family protein [Clostridiales bacterium]|nr:polysaccharide pyruvyl transferase family protein [Clostridiales bacterium]
MKTLTVTLHHTTNYGATLQAYALQQTLFGLGHENVIFEYKYQNKTAKSKTNSFKAILRDGYFFIKKIFCGKKSKMLKKSFSDFHKNKMVLTRVYDSMEDLRNDPPVVDAYITGSDQVWNLSKKNIFTPARFLDFGGSDIIRLSYAASIETLKYSDEDKVMVRNNLKRFRGISLREQSACDYISEITGRNTVHVVDPVFLLSPQKWLDMAVEPRISGPYILVYQVLRNDRMQEVADYLKSITGFPIVQICNSQVKWIKADKTFYDVSPEEFIGFYKHASIVVSASFHGTALGLVFGKPTYGLVRNEFGSRIKEILEMFGLVDFCIGQYSTIPDPNIDVDVLKEKINLERERSLSFLNDMLFENFK